MPGTATARAQAAHQRLDQAAKDLKAAERAVKGALRTVRQVQAELIGIEVTTSHPGGTDGNSHTGEEQREAAGR